MSDTASIRLPRTASVAVRPAKATRASHLGAPATRSPRAAYAAGTYVVVDAEYASRAAGTFTGTGTGASHGTFVSVGESYSARTAGSYVD